MFVYTKVRINFLPSFKIFSIGPPGILFLIEFNSADRSDLCANTDLVPKQTINTILKDTVFNPFKTSLPPINAYVSHGVVVGVDTTQSIKRPILLNKALAYDENTDKFSTVLYYALVSGDYGLIGKTYEDVPDVFPIVIDQYLEGETKYYQRPLKPPVGSVSFSLTQSISALASKLRPFSQSLYLTYWLTLFNILDRSNF